MKAALPVKDGEENVLSGQILCLDAVRLLTGSCWKSETAGLLMVYIFPKIETFPGLTEILCEIYKYMTIIRKIKKIIYCRIGKYNVE